jgi:hypothetical protein
MYLSQKKRIKINLVGDTEIDPKSDILGQAGIVMRTDRCLDFPA